MGRWHPQKRAVLRDADRPQHPGVLGLVERSSLPARPTSVAGSPRRARSGARAAGLHTTPTYPASPMSTDPDQPVPEDEDYDPEISEGEAPQAMRLFNEPTESDVHLDRANPAFDRVQDDKAIDQAYERDYNSDYVKEHGDQIGHEPTQGPEGDKRKHPDEEGAG